MNKPSRIQYLLLFLSLLLGAQLTLAFAPFNIFIIAFTSPALLLTIWMISNKKQAFLNGLLFGIGLYSTGIYWVYISIHTFGGAPPLLAGIITALFILILALFIAIQGYLLTRFFPKNNLIKLLIAFPVGWILFELLRSWLFTGFPWLLLGYSQLTTPLKFFAPLFEVYGVSFAVVLTSAAMVGCLLQRCLKNIMVCLFVIALTWSGAIFLGYRQTQNIDQNGVKITIVQGNIPLQVKWDPYGIDKNLKTYYQLTNEHWDSRIIVWPEAAIPAFNWQVEPALEKLDRIAKSHNTTIITGIPYQDLKSKRIYNAMISLGVDKNIYLKRHLVPFGEYLPFAKYTQWLLDYLKIPMSDFSSGPNKQPPFVIAGITIAPAICYEIAYPHEIASYIPQAKLIITITEDAWFGNSTAPAQHLQIAQMRSLETGRYQLFSTNTGISAIIGPNGKIIKQAPAFKRTTISAKFSLPLA